MIYANAETGEDVARLLNMSVDEEKRSAYVVAERLLGKPSRDDETSGIVIVAPRKVGKTTELLRFAEKRNPNGNFIVVCHNFERQKYIIQTHWKLFNNIGASDIVAARLLGTAVISNPVNPPLMVSPGAFHLLKGNSKPIYIDELGAISNQDTMSVVIATGRFVAAVTS